MALGSSIGSLEIFQVDSGQLIGLQESKETVCVGITHIKVYTSKGKRDRKHFF